MARAMDEAGLLNSMSVEDLRVTCERLQRSCQDMTMLLNEFEEEQAMLQQEQDRLHQRVEKATARLQPGRQDQGFMGNLLKEMETQLENSSLLSDLFRAKQERKRAKSRRWSADADLSSSGGGKVIVADGELDEEVTSPFSEANVKLSWACVVALDTLQKSQKPEHGIPELAQWVREVMCGEPVAEAEALPDAMWAAQLAASQASRNPDPSPKDRRNSQSADGFAIDSPLTQRSTSRSRPAEGTGAFGPDGVQMSPEASGGEDNNSFETIVGSALGIVSAVGGQQVAQQMAQQVSAVQHVAQQARAAVKAKVEDGGSGADLPAPNSLSRRVQEAHAVFGAFADWASGGAAAMNSSRGEPSETEVTITLTVVLKRASESQKWGLSWMKEAFRQNKERTMEFVVEQSVAQEWNRQQERAGHPELCIQPGDRLVSANGRTNREEITAELASREVVLEFHRTVRRRVVEEAAAAQSKALGTVNDKPLASQFRDARQKKFQASFSAYLQNKAPGSFSPEKPIPEQAIEEDQALIVPNEEPVRLPESSEPQGEEPSAAKSMRQILLEEAMNDDDEVEADEPCEVPYGVVAQVLSLQSGSVRLSWLFDWESSPSEMRGEDWACQGFEVLRSSGDDGADEEEPEVIKSTAPLASLTLTLGMKHRFQVRAILSDSRANDEGSQMWSSPLSSAVSADLRSAGAAPPRPMPTDSASTSEEEPKRIEETKEEAEVEAKAGVEAKTEEPVAAATAPPGKPKPKGRVAANFGNFLAQMQPAKSTSSPPAESSEAAPSGDSSPKKILMGGSLPTTASNPLTAAQPRVVSAGAMDPAREKWELSERLRLRAGHLGHQEMASKGLELRPRSSSFDSDDEESLFKISNALSKLEKSQASMKQRDEMVAEEGHHSLQRRLEASAGTGPQEPLRVSAPPSSASTSSRVPPEPVVPPEAPGESENLHSLEAAIATAGSAGREESDTPASTGPFRLKVQLANYQTAFLEFEANDDLPSSVANLVAKYHMRDVCEKPLLERAEQLLRSGQNEDSVDIIDLL